VRSGPGLALAPAKIEPAHSCTTLAGKKVCGDLFLTTDDKVKPLGWFVRRAAHRVRASPHALDNSECGPFRARARMMPATNAQDFPETRQGRMDDGAMRMFRRCGAGGLRTRFGRGIFPAAGSLPATRRKS
jgi:hypothetical protein